MSALRELSRAHARELLRNGRQTVLMSTWFLMVFLAFGAAQLMLTAGKAPSVVTVSGPAAQVATVEAALRDAGVALADTDASGTSTATLALTVAGDSATAQLLSQPSTSWGAPVRAVARAGIPFGQITVLDAEGGIVPDILRTNLGSVLLVGVLSVLVVSGTGPFVALRARGTLKLLRTAPVSPGVALAAFLPVRLALCGAMALVVLATAVALGVPPGLGLLRLGVTALVAIVLVTAFAALLAARSANEEAMENLLPLVIMCVFAAAMAHMFVPILPAGWQVAIGLLPTSWFVEAVNADLIGSTPLLPLPALWALMLALAAGLAVLAVRRFRWQ